MIVFSTVEQQLRFVIADVGPSLILYFCASPVAESKRDACAVRCEYLYNVSPTLFVQSSIAALATARALSRASLPG